MMGSVHFQAFLSFTFAGALLAGGMVGALVEGGSDLVPKGIGLGLGLWLVLVGCSFLRDSPRR